MKEEGKKEYKWLTEEELLSWCVFYKGEKECPSCFNDKEMQKMFWGTERIALDTILTNQKIYVKEETDFIKNPRIFFAHLVLGIIGDHCPYEFNDAVKFYERRIPELCKHK